MNILGLGLPEIIIIALVLLLFFGQKRLPGLFRSLGSSIGELKRGLQDTDDGDASGKDTAAETDAHAQSSAKAQPTTAEATPKKKTPNS